MGDSSSQTVPFLIVLALVLAAIGFIGLLIITVIVLATLYPG